MSCTLRNECINLELLKIVSSLADKLASAVSLARPVTWAEGIKSLTGNSRSIYHGSADKHWKTADGSLRYSKYSATSVICVHPPPPPHQTGAGSAVRTHREEIEVKVQQSHEHEHQQHSAAQLHVLLGRALPHGRDPGEHALSFRSRLGQQQEQAAPEGEVPVEGRGRVAG